MTGSDPTYSDRAVQIGEAIHELYLADAWPEAIEQRFVAAGEAVANLVRDLKELEAGS